jgi:hypothetical protein
MPTVEVSVFPGLVRWLLIDQHPDLAGLDIEVLANGWDNVVGRLGSGYLVRLPRRAASAGLVANEQRWLPGLAGHLPLPVPAPVRTWQPGRGYPWAWSVSPFLPGEIAARTPPADPGEAALTLGGFLAALHLPAPVGAPVNPSRGIPLAGRTAGVIGLNSLTPRAKSQWPTPLPARPTVTTPTPSSQCAIFSGRRRPAGAARGSRWMPPRPPWLAHCRQR